MIPTFPVFFKNKCSSFNFCVKIYFILCVWVLHTCMYVQPVCAWPLRPEDYDRFLRTGHKEYLEQPCGCWWHTWIASVLNCWTVYPTPFLGCLWTHFLQEGCESVLKTLSHSSLVIAFLWFWGRDLWNTGVAFLHYTADWTSKG